MKVQTRAELALEALTLLLDLADHRDICIATSQGKRGFCNYEKEGDARYRQLINKIYGGKYARPKIEGETVGECPTNLWFADRAKFEKARTSKE